MNSFKIILTNNGTNSPHKAPTSDASLHIYKSHGKPKSNESGKKLTQTNAHPKYAKNGRWSFNFGRIDIRR